MSNQPLLSIVIPTKNRQRFCLSAVNSILNIDDERIQVVVQDNSTDNSLQTQLPIQYTENRLKYRYQDGTISFVNNFNLAIDNADGEYICIIGDDDGVNPEIIYATAWAKQNNIDCLTGSVCATYRWDNVGNRKKFFIKLPSSSLTMTKFTGRIKKVNLEHSLVELVKEGCASYAVADFPKLYHGIVKKASLEKLKDITGSYLKGLSPDIYAAIALACIDVNLVVIDYPLTMPGVCAASGSIIEGERKENSRELTNAPHFRGRTEPYVWEENVPKIYCVETIWADSAFAALREFNRDDLFNYFDDFVLAATIIEADATVAEKVYKFLMEKHKDLTIDEIKANIKKIKYSKLYLGKLQLNFTKAKRALKIEEFKIIPNLHNMEQATLALAEYLDNSGIKLGNSLSNLDTSLFK